MTGTDTGCETVPGLRTRCVLYCGVSAPRYRLMAGAAGEPLDDHDGLCSEGEGEVLRLFEGGRFLWRQSAAPADTLQQLSGRYVGLLVLDMRRGSPAGEGNGRGDGDGDGDGAVRRGFELLSALDDPSDAEARYGFHRILALVGGGPRESVDQTMVELGRRGVRHVLRDRSRAPGTAAAFARRAAAQAMHLVLDRAPQGTALCAAGGGITGIYFEQAALKCLGDCIGEEALHDFDMCFGISAGAVVMSVLCNGYSMDEFMAAIAGVEGGRIPFTDLSLLKLGHFNLQDMASRLHRAARGSVRGVVDAARGRTRIDADAIFLAATGLVGAPFRSDEFGETLGAILGQPGATNDFRKLRNPLYIGASDQDAKEHVLFGSEGREDVPISLAVQASMSINPAFSAVQIGDRWYSDGAVTRTSEFLEAIKRGAGLVFVFDPFVPYVSHEAGVTQRRGMLYNIDQDVRSLSYTRFESVRDQALRRHPEVSSYTFLPSNSSRRRLSANPMDHRPFLAVWRDAYLSTLGRVQHLKHRMCGDLAAHGIPLDTAKAEAVAERLEATKVQDLDFADFFPNRRVAIARPPLVGG